mmetsp:Transcript_25327/g.45830  ORF Transcript_25327/g.45830 Transcript_25327/m.45830 type:complete len:209 (+) Transcript_25327:1374-2000(+)
MLVQTPPLHCLFQLSGPRSFPSAACGQRWLQAPPLQLHASAEKTSAPALVRLCRYSARSCHPCLRLQREVAHLHLHLSSPAAEALPVCTLAASADDLGPVAELLDARISAGCPPPQLHGLRLRGSVELQAVCFRSRCSVPAPFGPPAASALQARCLCSPEHAGYRNFRHGCEPGAPHQQSLHLWRSLAESACSSLCSTFHEPLPAAQL